MSVSALRRFYQRWLPLALALTAVASLFADELTGSRAFNRHHSGSLTHLVHTEQPTVDRRYGIYMEMADALGGSTLVVPEDSALSGDLARGLANVELEERDYDATDVSGVVLEGEPLGSFQAGDERVPYWIVSDGEGTRWWLGQTSEGIVIVPDTVAPRPGTGS